MNQRGRKWSIGLGFAVCASLSMTAAAAASVGSGLNWLAVSQESSGLWGTSQGTPFRDAAASVTTLKILGVGSSTIDLGIQALHATPTSSTDYLARGILANAIVNPGIDSTGSTALVARQNADGGWGYNTRYPSNVLETSLALEALKRAGYTNNTVVGAGLGWLVARQNADKGWLFAAGDTSRVFYTAHALTAF